MGQSTNGQICFGLAFEEDTEFPWDAEEFDGNNEEWWLSVLGFKSTIEVFGEDEEYLTSIPEEQREKLANLWYEERRQFRDSHNPFPVELVNICSGDYPQYILAVPWTVKTARRGYPEVFNPRELVVNIGDVIALEKFCQDHGIKYAEKPQWWLSSYWG